MAGTIYSTGGFRRVTRKLIPRGEMRVFGFFVVLVCSAILITWMTRTLWSQFDQLRKDHAAVKGESFYSGVHLRGALRALNDQLLQYGTSHNPTFRDEFLNDSAELKDWIATHQVTLADTADLQLLKGAQIAKQLQLLQQIQSLYESYLTNAKAILLDTNTAIDARTFEESYKWVREISSGLFPLCDDLVTLQREGFGEMLRGTQTTLINHQRLLIFSSALILGLGVIVATTVYRGMITPLRIGLSESEKIIERQEKLASLGTLASGVAHEIRNPLTAIKFRLFSLRKALPEVSKNEDAAVIGDEIDRLEDIVQNFLQFARPSEPKLSRIQAGPVLTDICNLLHPQLDRAAITLNMEASEAISIFADPQQLKQVLINLIQNGAESIGRNGAITLRVRREAAAFGRRNRPAAVFSVQDTGQGIPPEIQIRLFDPFFTTKEGGTGLGLAISARIVEKHGGLLRYETELNRGTTFEVVLPAADDNAGKYTFN